MEYTMEARTNKIIENCLLQKSKNPIEIFCNIADMDYIRIHGPEHHILDGAVSSMGAALAIIDGTGPLSTDGTWGKL